MSSRDSNSLLELGASPTFRVSAAAAILCGAPGGSDARAAGVPTRLFRPPVGTARLWACMLRHASFRAQRRLRYRLLARAGMGAAVLSEQDRAFRAAAGQGPRLHLPNGGIAPNCALIASDLGVRAIAAMSFDQRSDELRSALGPAKVRSRSPAIADAATDEGRGPSGAGVGV